MRSKKNKFVSFWVGAFSLFLFQTGKAQVPTADFDITPLNICAGAIVQVSDLSTGLPNAWSYTLNGSPAVSSAQNPTVTFNAAGIYTISLICSNGTGPSSEVSKTISVNAAPVLTLTGNNAFCAGSSVTQTVSGADTYTWSTGGTSDTEVFNPSVNTTYTVSGTDNITGCSASETLAITVNALPLLTVSGNSAVCLGSSVSQTVSGADVYLWDDGSNGNTIALSPSVTTAYTVSGTNTLTGCSDSTSVLVIVNALPVLSITGTNSVCANSAVTQSVTGADAYLWAITGATTGVVTLNPASTTVYTVTGTNTITGCSDIATISISVFALPSLTLSGNTAFCAGASVTQTVTGADTYSWSTGATTDVETFNPTTSTSYTVTGTNSLTSCFNKSTIFITVNALPTVTVNNGALCAGQAFVMNPGGAATYTYSSGTATVTPISNSIYSVTGTSAAGCISSNTAIASVTVNALPTLTVNSGAICTGGTFTIVPGGAATYTVSGGSTVVNPTSSFSYSITGTSSQGCISSNTAVASVVVNPLPTISVSGNTTICAGVASSLTASGANTYTWSNSVINTTVSVSPSSSTIYTVIGTDNNGCSNFITQVITVNPLPTVTVNSGTICQGSAFVLLPTGATSYVYSSGTDTVTPTSTTSYTVMGMSAAGCISALPAISTVNVVNAVTVTVSGVNAICKGSGALLSASGAPNYTWSTGATTSTIAISPLASTNYTVIGVDGPCSTATIVSLTVNALPTVSVSSNNPEICIGESVNLVASGASSYTWNTAQNGSQISISPVSNTSYTVTGTDANGCTNVANITQNVSNCTGIHANTNEMVNVNIYPNPNNGEFVMEVEQNLTVTILNSIGQVIYADQLEKGSNPINLNNQPKGIYFVSPETR